MNRSHRILRIPLLALLATALLVPAPALAAPAAQTSGVTLEAAAGFDGYFRPDEATPIRVAVANEGPDLDARIEVERPGNTSDASTDAVYIRSVALPTHSRKIETLYVPGAPGLKYGKVRLVAGTSLLAETDLRATAADSDDLIAGVLSSAPGTLDFLAGIHAATAATHVARLTLDALPAQPAGWDSLDVLVIDDMATDALTGAQRASLEDWVSRGGLLVVGGGPGWQATASGLGPLLPAEASGTAILSTLAALNGSSVSPLAPGPYVVARLAARAGARVVLAEGDTPLLVRGQAGSGGVVYLALSTTLSPLSAWGGNADFWQQTVLEGRVRRAGPPDGVQHFPTAAEALLSLSTLRLPSVTDLFCLLGVYMLIIGPLNYFVLRRLKRLELAWITIPAVVLLFTAVTYLTGVSFRGTRPTLHRLAVVRAQAGNPEARADLLIGLYSPQRRDYDLRLPGRVAVRPLYASAGAGIGETTTIADTGDATLIQGVRVDIAGMRQFAARAAVPGPGLTANVALSTDAGGSPHVTGTLRNDGALTLRGTALIYGTTVATLGDLAPGAQLQVDERLYSGGSAGTGTLATVLGGYVPYGSSDREAYRKWQLGWSALSPTGAYGGIRSLGGELYLLAWVDAFPGQVEIPGTSAETSDLSLYLIQLSNIGAARQSEIGPGGGIVLARDLDMTYTVADRSGDVYDADLYALSLGPDSYVAYILTPQGRLDAGKVVTLTYTLESPETGARLPSVALWNWSAGRFEPADPRAWGTATVIARAGAYVNSSGEINLRITSAKSKSFVLDGFALALEAIP